MQKTMMKHSLSLVVCFLFAFAAQALREPIGKNTTVITLDGVETTVFFNDGDTFRVIDGAFKSARVRIVGINSLETYGPVHQWHGNTKRYLLEIADAATAMARGGHWSCTTEKEKDVYGRLLAECSDLALSLLSHGYAHAYSIDSKPAKGHLINAQKEAQKSHLGMWKHGIPEFIITSLHSATEEAKEHYNRLISTGDGHTKKWHHQKELATCELVCIDLTDSCMVHVPFEKRYGSNRPECLR